MKLTLVWVPLFLFAATAYSATSPQVETFSSMRYIEEAGDVLGWDIQLTHVGNTYTAIIECAEGQPVGPVKAVAQRKGSYLVLHPDRSDCGQTIRLKFVARGLTASDGANIPEFVPRHKLSGWFPKEGHE